MSRQHINLHMQVDGKTVGKVATKYMESHDGDLGHNSTVYYDDDPYSTADGETYYVRSVMISDKMRCIALLPKEALSLLTWLQSERVTLEKLVNEEG